MAMRMERSVVKASPWRLATAVVPKLIGPRMGMMTLAILPEEDDDGT